MREKKGFKVSRGQGAEVKDGKVEVIGNIVSDWQGAQYFSLRRIMRWRNRRWIRTREKS